MNGVRGFMGEPLTRSASFYVLIYFVFRTILSIRSTETHILYPKPILAQTHILFHHEIYFSI